MVTWYSPTSKVRLVLAVRVLVFLMVACKNTPQLTPVQHEPSFGDSLLREVNPDGVKQVGLDLREVFKFDWDSIVVVPAYAEYGKMDELGLKNSASVEKAFKEVVYRDDITTFLFVRDSTIVRCERFYNRPIYLGSIIQMPSKGYFTVISRTRANTLILRKINRANRYDYNLYWENRPSK